MQRIVNLNDNVLFLRDYHSYWIVPNVEKNPSCDQDSRRIMDVKNPGCRGYNKAVEYFGAELGRWITSAASDLGFLQVAIVPSSTAGKQSAAIESMLKYVKAPPILMYNPNFLVRHKSVTPAHSGGQRSEELHMQTIRVNAYIDPKIPVLLLDDVYTTGASVNACKRLLRDAGAKTVVTVAIGRTV
jgi:hypothetical protein